MDDAALVGEVLAGRRRALAKAITLVESSRADHAVRASRVLEALLPHAGRSIRVGISGAPGVGKSTLIEALGLYLIGRGHRLAVLAVDPSSSRSGGSILGDKTRMERLSMRQEAFIRPSPAGGHLGGVAGKTREAILVCEAAGFDVVIVETVGVGQNETAVAGMTDVFVLMQLPNAGDELQALKKGIVELADLVLVNKADLDPKAAELACVQMKNALSLLRPSSKFWQARVLPVSAARDEAIAASWQAIEAYRTAMHSCGEFEAKRRRQALAWMWTLIDSALMARFRSDPGVKAALPGLSAAVESGKTTPVAAADQLLACLNLRS